LTLKVTEEPGPPGELNYHVSVTLMTDKPRTFLLERAGVARLLAANTTIPELANMLVELAKACEREAEDDKGAAVPSMPTSLTS